MSEIITIGTKAFEVGVDWHQIDPTKAFSAEIRTLRADKKKELEKEYESEGKKIDPKKIQTFTHGYVLKYRHGVSVGLVPNNKKIKSGKSPSLLAWLSRANQHYQETLTSENNNATGSGSMGRTNWIIVEKIDAAKKDGEDLYWFGVVVDGLPYLSSDEICTFDEVSSHLLTLFLIASDGYTIFSPDLEIQSLSEDYPLQAQSIDEILKDVKYDIKLKSLSGIPSWFIPLVGGAVLFFVGYYGYTQWENSRLIKLAQILNAKERAEMLQKQKEKEKAYAESVKQTVINGVQQGANELNSTLQVSNPVKSVDSWFGMISKMPIFIPGWTIEHTTCTIDRTNGIGHCVLFVKIKDGDDLILLNLFPDAKINGDSATIDFTNNQMINNPNIVASNLISGNYFNNNIKSNLQILRNYGYASTISGGKNIVKTITLPPKPVMQGSIKINLNKNKPNKNGNIVNVDLGVSTGSLKIELRNQNNTNLGIFALKAIEPLLNLKGVVLTSIDYNKGTWTVMGNYFVRILNKPVIPEITLDDGTKINVSLPDNESWVSSLISSNVDLNTSNNVNQSTLEAAQQNQNNGQQLNNQSNQGQSGGQTSYNPLNLPSLQ